MISLRRGVIPVEIEGPPAEASSVLFCWQGHVTVRAERAQVWDALHDVDCLGRCLPGCAWIARRGLTHYDLAVDQKIGPVGLRMNGTVSVVDVDPGRAYTLVADGGAGPWGRLTGATTLTFAGERHICRIGYKAEAELTGPIAVIGALALPMAAPAVCRRFGERFRSVVESRAYGATTQVRQRRMQRIDGERGDEQ